MKLEKDEDISAYYRGLLIQQTIDLELRMEIIIGRFLSMNNQERTLDLIEIFDIAIVDFSQKVKVLKYIVRKYIPDFLEDKNALSENRNKFFSDLTYVMERRNELAHIRPDLKTNNHLKLSWIGFDNKSKLIPKELNLTDKFRLEYGEKCAECYITLIDIENKVCVLK